MLDVRGGKCVHAQSGDRSRYPELRSVLSDSSNPIEVARAVREKLGLEELYLADLDMIERNDDRNWRLIEEIANDGFKLWLDSGIRGLGDLAQPNGSADHLVVVGSESLENPSELRTMVAWWDTASIVFSFDHEDGCQGLPRRRVGSGALPIRY